jgi:hypothetical protein
MHGSRQKKTAFIVNENNKGIHMEEVGKLKKVMLELKIIFVE